MSAWRSLAGCAAGIASARLRLLGLAVSLLALLCASPSRPLNAVIQIDAVQVPLQRSGGLDERLASAPLGALLGVRVDGASLVLEGAPGLVYVHNMVISSSDQDPAMDIQLGVFGMGQGPEGEFLALPVDQDTGPYSARSYVAGLSTTAFRLAPGAFQPVEVTVRLPMNLDSACHYAVLLIGCSPVDAGSGAAASASVLTRYLVPVVILPRSSAFVRAAAIEAASLQADDSGQAVDVMMRIRNTGNCHFRVRGRVAFTGPAGARVGELEAPLSFNSVIPGQARVFQQTFRPAARLANGRYVGKISAFREDGGLLGEREVEFWVGPHPTATTGSGRRQPTPTEAGLGTSPIATGAPVTTVAPTITLTALPLLAPTRTITSTQPASTSTPSVAAPAPEAPRPGWAWLPAVVLTMLLLLALWAYVRRIRPAIRKAGRRG